MSDANAPETAPAAPPQAAMALGLAGLLPFFATAAGSWLAGPLLDDAALEALSRIVLAVYGALILSFMGGCRWGFAAAGLGDRPMTDFVLSVSPALLGFFLLIGQTVAPGVLDIRLVCATLAAGFALLYLSDVAAAERGAAPAWWPMLRLPLTIGAAGSLLAGALS